MHYQAIHIDPQWREDDFVRVREWLRRKISQRLDDPYDDVVRGTTFERRADPTGELYVACYQPPIRPAIVVWVAELEQFNV